MSQKTNVFYFITKLTSCYCFVLTLPVGCVLYFALCCLIIYFFENSCKANKITFLQVTGNSNRTQTPNLWAGGPSVLSSRNGSVLGVPTAAVRGPARTQEARSPGPSSGPPRPPPPVLGLLAGQVPGTTAEWRTFQILSTLWNVISGEARLGLMATNVSEWRTVETNKQDAN